VVKNLHVNDAACGSRRPYNADAARTIKEGENRLLPT